MKKKFINYPLLFLVGIAICGITILGLARLNVDTDVIKSLPKGEQVIADALEIFQNHPIHDQVAVDNEDTLRHDVRLVLLFSTAGMALLLFLFFRRPLLGLLSLAPAVAGTAAALLVYSLFHSSLSIMALVFGAALVAISVDYGIVNLLFLDNPQEARRAGGMIALLTTLGAFLVLSCSGFPLFTELGQFTALSFLFTYLLGRHVFPLTFPTVPPASNRFLSLHRLVNLLYHTGKPGAVAAFLLALVFLGHSHFSSFSTGLPGFLIIAASVVLLLFLYFLNWQLTLITLMPPLFASICTLGTLKLIGHPLDIAGLMFSPVILGMGLTYALAIVCGHQWYGRVEHPSYVLVRSTVFMAAASTLIGFGVLCFAQHSLLRSIGITSFFGITYSLLGAFLLLPPLLQWYFAEKEQNSSRETTISRRIMHRYRHLEAYPRMFVRCKLRFDPLFNDLSHLLAEKKGIRTILDIGCGYGVPACWCLEHFPDARIFGMEPNSGRARVAARATDTRGIITQDRAPALPAVSQPVDVILLLDMLHYLDDDKVLALFEKGYQTLAHNGILVARFVIDPAGKRSWTWYLEHYRSKLAGIRPSYRSIDSMAKMLTEAGFVVAINRVAASNTELGWLVGRADKEA